MYSVKSFGTHTSKAHSPFRLVPGGGKTSQGSMCFEFSLENIPVRFCKSWMRGLKLAFSVVAVILLLGPACCQARQGWLTWNIRAGLPSNDLTSLAIVKGKIAVGSPQGIGVFCENRSTWINLAAYGKEFASLVVRDLDFDREGNLWAATPNGLAFLQMAEFPDKPPLLEVFSTDRGLSTIDVEVLQIVDDTLFVGCFGGWLFQSKIGAGTPPTFQPLYNLPDGTPEDRKFLNVGISALALDAPGGGIFATKGRGLLGARDGRNYLSREVLPAEWVDDFWCFQEDGKENIIALTQNKLNLISEKNLVAAIRLPDPEAEVSCLTTCLDEETNQLHPGETDEQAMLRKFMGKRILFVGTKGKGLWMCDEGKWSHLTTADCPLPSDQINRIYYLFGAKRVAILSNAGLTLFGTEEQDQYDEFKRFGVGPTYAKTFWPFMLRWGPYIFGYPWKFQYPYEPFISYKKILRGRDLWVSHEKGISRFVYPQAFFLGAMQVNYRLTGRYENPLNDPSKNLNLEDNSTSGGNPPGLPGERIWHHYCLEPPNDVAVVDLTKIFTTLDRKTLVGPLNQLLVEGQPTETISDDLRRQILIASQTLGVPPVLVFQNEEKLFDSRGHELFSIDSLSPYCPRHPLPELEITDMAVDAGERCWIITNNSSLSCLDEPGSVVPETSSQIDATGNFWNTLRTEQQPWPTGESLLCVRRVGVDIYVGTEKSGVFVLPRAQCFPIETLKSDSWVSIKPRGSPDDPDRPMAVIDCASWKCNENSVVALLHRQGLSVYDGAKIESFPIPERRNTCLCTDRNGDLWIGSFQGLLRITPDRQIHQIPGAVEGFQSDKIVTLAAAPDNAKYPYLIGVVCDKLATEEQGRFKSSDARPFYTSAAGNPHKLRLVEASIDGAQLLLYDGKKWEPFKYPGIIDLMFDEMYLWTTTSFRVIRYYLPVVAQSY